MNRAQRRAADAFFAKLGARSERKPLVGRSYTVPGPEVSWWAFVLPGGSISDGLALQVEFTWSRVLTVLNGDSHNVFTSLIDVQLAASQREDSDAILSLLQETYDRSIAPALSQVGTARELYEWAATQEDPPTLGHLDICFDTRDPAWLMRCMMGAYILGRDDEARRWLQQVLQHPDGRLWAEDAYAASRRLGASGVC